MKRFFPLLLGLTLICFSFINKNESKPIVVEDAAVNSVIKICDYMLHLSTSQNVCDPSSAELTIGPNCEGSVTIFVRTTNLHTTPVMGQVYPLPYGIPDIYYEYTANGITNVLGPINTFEYTFDHKGGGQPVYEYSTDISFDVTPFCKINTKTQFFCDVRLAEENGNDYNLTANGDHNGIFSCQVFEESCNNCGTCTGPPGDLYYNTLICGEACPLACIPPKNLVKNDEIEAKVLNSLDHQTEFIVDLGTEKSNDSKELEVEVSPNPFMNYIELTFSENINSDLSIEIINPNGSVLKRNFYKAISDKSINIDVSDIPSGFYYCKITSGSNIFTKRIVKL